MQRLPSRRITASSSPRLRAVAAVAAAVVGSAGLAAASFGAAPARAAVSPDVAALITNVSAARSVYHLKDSTGASMDTLKVVRDPTAARYLGVYHSSIGGVLQTRLATSTDLRTWTYQRTLDTAAAQPSIAFSPKNGVILAVETDTDNHLRFRYYTSVTRFLAGTVYKTFDAPRTLSSCAEGTPDLESVTYAGGTSTITSGSTIVVSHHYFANCSTDREALGTLTNFSHWSTAAQPAFDDALLAAGAAGKHGDRDTFTVGGQTLKLVEGNTDPAFSWNSWRNYLYDPATQTAQPLSITTAGGSTSFANPTATVAVDPSGVPSLIVTEFLPVSGSATGEAGELLYWNPLPTASSPSPSTSPSTSPSASPSPSQSSSPAPSTSPTSSLSPSPTTSPVSPSPTGSVSPSPTTSPTVSTSPSPSTSVTPLSTGIDKVLVVMEENHSLTEMESGMPYLYSLAKQYGYATDYTAITHPSEPNYVAITFGSTMGDTVDHSTAVSYAGPTVFGQALAAGRTARVYAESMPSPCLTTNASPYYVKHNPWPFAGNERTACQSGDVPLGTTTSGVLHSDVVNGRLPSVGMIVPNICNDAHDCSLATADGWLKQWLPQILNGPDFTSGRLAVVVTADEDDRNSGNKVLTAVLHPSLHGKVVSTALTHYSLTGFIDQVLHASPLRNAATAPSFATAFALPIAK